MTTGYNNRTATRPGETIVISDDDDDDNITSRTRLLSVQDDDEAQPAALERIDLSGLDDEDGVDGQDYLRELSSDLEFDILPDLPPGHYYVNTVDTPLGATLNTGDCVELLDGNFLRIIHIVRSDSAIGPYLKGHLFRRNRRVGDMLPKKLNEVCMILKTDINAHQDLQAINGQVCRPVSGVTVVRDLIITDRPFPALSFRENPVYAYAQRRETPGQWLERVEDTGILICRWKFIEQCDRSSGTVKEGVLTALQEDEADPKKGMSSAFLRKQWRGAGVEEPRKSGSRARQQDSIDLTGDSSARLKGKRKADIDLTSTDDDYEYEERLETTVQQEYRRSGPSGILTKRSRTSSVVSYSTTIPSTFKVSKPGKTQAIDQSQQRGGCGGKCGVYTYGDICCGAGGMTSGAQQAGLKINFMLDNWDDACKTAKLNFPTAKVLQKDIFEFCTMQSRSYCLVDILHISFPCQPHSPAHTHAGKNDEKNIAAGYSAIPLLQRCRPRIVTFEQTSGLLTHNNSRHFQALIHQLTEIGYSCRWQIINCAELGNVQARKRLFILAAAPGEILPPFPAPTHGTGVLLKPLTTIRDRLRLLPARIEQIMRSFTTRSGNSYSADKPLLRAITTSGGDSNLHPSGERSFNLQELALLQGFRAQHLFFGGYSSIKRQIGNAVPSMVAKTIFDEVVKSLKETDRKAAAVKKEVIELD